MPGWRRTLWRALILLGVVLGAAQAQPAANQDETLTPAETAASDEPRAETAPVPEAEGQQSHPDGRLLPGLLLGLLLGIGAYHIGRQVYDSAPGSRGASALLVSGFAYEYVAFGLHEPLVGTGRPSLMLAALAGCGVAVAGLGFLTGFLTLKNRNGPAYSVTGVLMGIAVLVAVLAPLKPQFAMSAAGGMLGATLVWSLGVAISYARQGDTRAAYLLPGLAVLAVALLGAAALLIFPSLNEAMLVPLLHGTFVIGLLVIAFAVTNAWNEPTRSYLALPAPVSAIPALTEPVRRSEAHAPRLQHEMPSQMPKSARPPAAREQQLGLALAASGHGLWDWDIREGRITVSPETEVMLGMEQGSFDGSEEAFLAAIADSDRDRFRQRIADRVAQGEGAFALAFAVLNDGASRRLRLEGTCFADRQGAVDRCIGLLREEPTEASAAPLSARAPAPTAAPAQSTPPPAERPAPAQPIAPASLAAELGRALEREAFELHYRPVVSLADMRVSGFEAELWWRHPKRGLVKPAEFMQVAEEKGLSGQIAKYALAMASVQLYQWQTFFPLARSLFASIAITEPRLLSPDLAASVKAVLSAASLAPGTLRLEIAERMVMDNATQAAEILGQLKRCGTGIVLDSEVTSASILSTLERFPVNAVKVSCNLSAGENAAGDTKALRSIIERARTLHMEVIASGVESEAQVKSLRALACEFAQGDYLGSALSAHEAQGVIARFWSG